MIFLLTNTFYHVLFFQVSSKMILVKNGEFSYK